MGAPRMRPSFSSVLERLTMAVGKNKRISKGKTPSPRRTGMTSRPPPRSKCAMWARPWCPGPLVPR
jgi:hypothetical protein